MRPLIFLLPIALLLPAAGAGAQAMAYPPPDTAPISWVQVTAPSTATRIQPREARQISGAYEMSNGWYLRVQSGRRYIDTIIDDQPALRLIPVAPYRFVSGDGNVSMQFNRGGLGDEMEMSYRPNRRLAQRVVISSRLAPR
ncbi:hypothetical protein [Massilia alkalitolerans]|uniref:hypothetical protein n=1 Tax=Massilia alkalitolerans TaxID=286638 RepID=UPI0028B070DC|nr:hypothetical protein [Massilia alkalitolerans]